MSGDQDRPVIHDCLSGNVRQVSALSGGDTHRCYRVELFDGGSVFAKLNSANRADTLATEAESLLTLRAVGADWYPQVLAQHQSAQGSALILDYRELTEITPKTSAELGCLLARQHRLTSPEFGWSHDNHIGLSPQINGWSSSWLDFYREKRLVPQLQQAIQNDLDSELLRRIEHRIFHLDEILDYSKLQPALLHGDLWTGNVGFDVLHNQAFLFDPAPYYGDPEADLAMTYLFGGFCPEFYAAYHELVPLRHGNEERRAIYKLYHALNHFNLFGRIYTGLVAQCLE
ncbi:fructosamine kinase family protein [Arenicella xantha]|uniref:Fructosamine-3-kinase n=1 Tax=Arenicella xantha TaxID=644221 RepID=A0A395JGP5_9GAMM|nr:fructosamine kinase family protein [Arenicella xantha]RBP48689.1 fructosamine-3-kinase [Arenicella xantha]